MKNVLILLSFGLLVSGCADDKNTSDIRSDKAASKVEFEYGTRFCEWTEDLIETVRYGAVITLNNRKIHFKSAECAAAWILQNEPDISDNEIQVVDFVDGRALIPARQALYLHSKLRPSPGKLYISALDRNNGKMLGRVYEAYPGPYLEWDEVLELVKREWGITSLKAAGAN